MNLKTDLGLVDLTADMFEEGLVWNAQAGLKRHEADYPKLLVNGVPYRTLMSGTVTRKGVVVVTYTGLRRGGASGGVSAAAKILAQSTIGAAVAAWSQTEEAQDFWLGPAQRELFGG